MDLTAHNKLSNLNETSSDTLISIKYGAYAIWQILSLLTPYGYEFEKFTFH